MVVKDFDAVHALPIHAVQAPALEPQMFSMVSEEPNFPSMLFKRLLLNHGFACI